MLRHWKAADVGLGARGPLGPGVADGLGHTGHREESGFRSECDGKPSGDFRRRNEKIPWVSGVRGQEEARGRLTSGQGC